MTSAFWILKSPADSDKVHIRSDGQQRKDANLTEGPGLSQTVVGALFRLTIDYLLGWFTNLPYNYDGNATLVMNISIKYCQFQLKAFLSRARLFGIAVL